MTESQKDLALGVEIPDIEVTSGHNFIKYTCNGRGLATDGAYFQADLSDFLPVIRKNPQANKTYSSLSHKRDRAWWRAQCSFRGLPIRGNITEMQARLRAGPTSMTSELVKLEEKSKAGWNAKAEVLRAEARQKRQEQEHLEEQKRIAEERNLLKVCTDRLKAIFGPETREGHVFKENCRGVDKAAKSLGLHFKWIAAPAVSGDLDWEAEWIIVAPSSDRVDITDFAVQKWADNRNYCQLQAHLLLVEGRQIAALASEAKRSSLAAAHAAISVMDGDWDITGIWKINCSDSGYEDELQSDQLSLRIHRITGTKVSQLFAEFDFGLFNGFFRFEDPGTHAISKHDIWDKRERLAWDRYLIPLKTKPSHRFPDWRFRWKGRGDPEATIEYDPEQNDCSMRFGEEGGVLSGTFEYNSTRINFAGAKIGTISDAETAAISIDREWNSYNNTEHDT
ncbi:hypothetical protein BT63DRAFT_421942 [Microthyrium microscopicum]|uniref:Uncharacterized protein n=1 Tax=Microthyrium microscopicum TaxID=703497 RepID=A0A6A6USC1_9PEZI|nr:hypothetical protein BT63DRAFT_421942 [Microthyrium microscopicum]